MNNSATTSDQPICKVFLSMTNTLLRFVPGRYTEEDMADAHFFFSCAKCHALPKQGEVVDVEDLFEEGYRPEVLPDSQVERGVWPFEVTWANKGLPHLYGHTDDAVFEPCATVLPEAVDPEFHPAMERFITILTQADTEGRVRWRSGNAWSSIEDLDDDVQAFHNGHCRPVAEWLNR